MIFSFLQRAGIVLRFLFPSEATRHYVRQIKRSGQFSRDFYLASNPRLRRLFRLAPERHYVLFGEAAGLSPCAWFSPRAYLYNNPDLPSALFSDTPPKGPAIRPLQHYIETGRAEQRLVLRRAGGLALPLPVRSEGGAPAKPAGVAIVVHLYYHQMWPEFAARLLAQSFAFDLCVTRTGTLEATSDLREQIRTAFPQAHIWLLPNHGRDIFPFLFLVNDGLLTPYRAVCKLHSKKSPHRADGDDWRHNLMKGVLGDPNRMQARLAAFLADPQAGIWVADGQHYQGAEWWGMNRARTTELLARGGIDITGLPLSFPAGSVYWIKPEVLEKLRSLHIGPEDFEPEQALVDGTTAHAVERSMGYLVQSAGLRIYEAHDLDVAG